MDSICTGIFGFIVLVVAAFWVHRQYKLKSAGRPWQWLRAKVGLGLGVEELAKRLGISSKELSGHSPSYREFRRKKRSGGERLIVAPETDTKKIQRAINHRLLGKLSVHPNSLGFRKGKSIVSHAQVHAGQMVVVRLDVVDFFSTTSAKRVEHYFRRIGWNKSAAALLTKLTTYKGGLPQGAPTSPALSNLVNYDLDVHLTTFVKRLERRWPASWRYPPLKARYSRYADDITFSLSRDALRRLKGKRGRGWVVRGLIEKTRRTLKVFGYRLHTKKKLLVRRRHQRQLITGLVVNVLPNLPRATRRKLRAARHHLATGKTATYTEAELQGWAAFQAMVIKQRKPLEPPGTPRARKGPLRSPSR
jgi:RNA-directed DNA polymerase